MAGAFLFAPPAPPGCESPSVGRVVSGAALRLLNTPHAWGVIATRPVKGRCAASYARSVLAWRLSSAAAYGGPLTALSARQ